MKDNNNYLYLFLLVISVLFSFELLSTIKDCNNDNRILRIENRDLKDENYISTFTYDRVKILLNKVKIMDKSIGQLNSNKNKMSREEYDNQMQEIHFEMNRIEDVLNELKIEFEY